jgi:antitoxin VapB
MSVYREHCSGTYRIIPDLTNPRDTAFNNMARTAKLFRNGRSQAVRLPADYRFEGSEVYVRRDPTTGDVILSRRPESWEDFFELMKSIDVPSDFLAERLPKPFWSRAIVLFAD